MGFPELDGNDAYGVLGVARDASADEIRRAHRALIKANHPDRFPASSPGRAEAEGRTRLINAAREILATRRADYDAYLPADAAPGRRRPHWAFALASIAIWAVVILVLLWFTRDPSPRATVPAALAGTWTGTLLSPGGTTWDLEITLVPGKDATEIRHGNGPCSLTAVPDRPDGAAVVLRPDLVGPDCDVREILVSPRSTGALYVELRTAGDPERLIEQKIRASGDLRRS